MHRYPLEVVFQFPCSLNPVQAHSSVVVPSANSPHGSARVEPLLRLRSAAIHGSTGHRICYSYELLSVRNLQQKARHSEERITDEELQSELALRCAQPTWAGALGPVKACTHLLPASRSRSSACATSSVSMLKARVGTEEMSVVVFLDNAGPETRKIIAAASRSEAPQFTAFPLSFSQDF